MLGYWIPGGDGNNHKLPPAKRGKLPPNPLDEDKKLLARMLNEWQYEPEDDAPAIKVGCGEPLNASR